MTNWAVDTSVAVPLVVETHPDYERIRDAVGERRVLLAGHALAETYSILTRLPGDMRFAAADAVTVIDDRFGKAICGFELPIKLPE